MLLVSDSFSLRAGPASRVLAVCLGLKLTSPLSRAPAPPTLRREAAPLSLQHVIQHSRGECRHSVCHSESSQQTESNISCTE